MANFSDLVNVSFQDTTSHQSVVGGDILGVILPSHWGPSEELNLLNRSEFFERYPEALPLGVKVTDAPTDFYYAYSQVKKYFDNGGSQVEIYRPNLGDKYFGVTKGEYAVTLKYPGSIPTNLLPVGTTKVKLTVTDTEVVLVAEGDASITLERWQGQFTDPGAVDSGQFTHFTKVLTQSQLLQCVESDDVTVTEVNDYIGAYTYPSISATALSPIVDKFADIEQSQATLLISPLPSSTELNTAVANVAEQTKTRVAIIGCPLDTLPSTLETVAQTLPKGNKFTINVFGIEFVSVFSTRVRSNCVGGYCGALANIANLVRVNQIASAKTYGAYNGALAVSPSFNQVLAFHELGITSVYNSTTGPQLFGVHNSLYTQKPNSYFAKSNVSRVLAAILRNIYPVAFEAIHTDAAANAITRASFASRFNSVINDFIARQNLQSDSYADLSDAINTDYLTKGGTVLNAILSLHFIGLVEKIDIKIVATDSSVNVEII